MGSQLILNCNGDFASQETVLGETNNGLKFSNFSLRDTYTGVLFTQISVIIYKMH